MSSLEKKIREILMKESIGFVQEKQYKDCYNGYYRYDFWVPERNALIEVNGQQHYVYTKFLHKKKTDFTKAQERDRRKISYALANNISLYVIPFWEIDRIGNSGDIFRKEYLATSKFHNDIKWREYQNSGVK